MAKVIDDAKLEEPVRSRLADEATLLLRKEFIHAESVAGLYVMMPPS